MTTTTRVLTGRTIELALVLLALLLVVVLVVVRPARGAPGPFRGIFGQAPTLHRVALVGRWECDWASVRCEVLLAPGGRYECRWPGCLYRGTWGVRGGLLWVEEETGCVDMRGVPSTRLYLIRLDPRTRGGPIEAGGEGTVRLLRRRPLRPW